ncbi:hypothetical protein KP509_03G013200 [Ceratopteris richardii]|uniref:Uncharacterized protein n=1 Tax=Ceratopteris richardii TaxID=49495 RepID=A0A8T2V086_CERRI|nr:hypothetical protein KP509_03G013200 [Ceratopteris richardii]
MNSDLQTRSFTTDRMESVKNTSRFNAQYIRAGRHRRPFHKSAAFPKFMSIQEVEDEGQEEELEDWKQEYHSGTAEKESLAPGILRLNSSCSSCSPSPSVSSSSSTSGSFSSSTPPCSWTIGAERTVSQPVSRVGSPPIHSTTTLLTITVLLLLLLLPLVLPPLAPPPLELMLLPVVILAFLMSSALFH